MMIKKLSAEQVKSSMNEGALVIDCRPSFLFADTFISGSLLLPLTTQWRERLLGLVPKGASLIFVVQDEEDCHTLEKNLSELHEFHVIGLLDGGLSAWTSVGYPTDMIITIEVDEFSMDLPYDNKLDVLDVRPEHEYRNGHVQGAHHLPLTQMNDLAQIAHLPDDHNIYIYCGGGNSAFIAASLLKRQGFERVRVVEGGYSAIRNEVSIPLVEPKSKLN